MTITFASICPQTMKRHPTQLKTLKVKKGEIIQHKGEINSKLYFIKKGLLRSYTIDQKGREHIFMFATEGSVIADATYPEDPCELFIDALEDSELTAHEKDMVRDARPGTLKMVIKCMVDLQHRVLMMMSESAIERYAHFESTYPQLMKRLPQRMIAAYLGITPEALSKIRSERARNK